MLSIAVIPLVLGIATVARTDDWTPPLPEKVAQVFSSLFFQQAQNEHQKHGRNPDLILSGFALLQPLALLTLASQGDSHDELLSNALGLADDATVKAVVTKYRELFGPIFGHHQHAVKVADKLYLAAHIPINKTFEVELTKYFDTYFEKMNFANASAAADEINNYVEYHTNHKVKNLVNPVDLHHNTEVVLVSTVHFKSEWEKKFNKVYTETADFFYRDGMSVQKDFMFQQNDFKHGFSNALDAELLQMNYKDKGFYFNIALPKEINGLSALLEKYKKHTGNLYVENNKFATEYVKVHLPKFEFAVTTDLEPVLESLGVKKIFQPDFGNLRNLLLNHSGVKVSRAIQNVFINVDEKGTEAASADEAPHEKTLLSKPALPPPVFKANLPFYYEVNYYGYTLVSGTVHFDPTLQE